LVKTRSTKRQTVSFTSSCPHPFHLKYRYLGTHEWGSKGLLPTSLSPATANSDASLTYRTNDTPCRPCSPSRQGCASSQIMRLQQIGTSHKQVQPFMLVCSISSISYCAGLALLECHHAGLILVRLGEWRRLTMLRSNNDRVWSPDSTWYGECHAAQRGDSPACVSSVKATRCYICCSCTKVLSFPSSHSGVTLCSLPLLSLPCLSRCPSLLPSTPT